MPGAFVEAAGRVAEGDCECARDEVRRAGEDEGDDGGESKGRDHGREEGVEAARSEVSLSGSILRSPLNISPSGLTYGLHDDD